MRIKRIVFLQAIYIVSIWGITDVEKEINEPVAEMLMLDDAMNRGIEEQRQRNARKPMIIEDDFNFDEAPMLEFIEKGNEYTLEKSVSDVNNSEVKTKLENRMLTVTIIKKIEEVTIEDSVTLGGTSTRKQYFESTTSETLALPNDADSDSLTSHYENGLLRVTIEKK